MIKLLVTDRDGQNHELDADTGLSLMENLRDQAYGVEAICGGLCSCGTCHVYIGENWLDKMPGVGVEEEEILEGVVDRETHSRLSCQVPVTDELEGMDLTIAPFSL